MLSPTQNPVAELRRSWPFLVTGALAIVVGGALSAALAHDPTRPSMWLVAYLVLVVGVAQVALGAGEMRLAARPPSRALLASQWLLFNAANALVIAGRLLVHAVAVAAGALVLAVALALFMRGVCGAGGGWVLHGYRLLVLLLGCGAVIGVGLYVWQASA